MDRTFTRYEARTILGRALDDPEAEFRDGQWEAIDGAPSHCRTGSSACQICVSARPQVGIRQARRVK